jgi:hypothetical protein
MPAAHAGDRVTPADIKPLALVLGHRRGEASARLPRRSDVVGTGEEAAIAAAPRATLKIARGGAENREPTKSSFLRVLRVQAFSLGGALKRNVRVQKTRELLRAQDHG